MPYISLADSLSNQHKNQNDFFYLSKTMFLAVVEKLLEVSVKLTVHFVDFLISPPDTTFENNPLISYWILILKLAAKYKNSALTTLCLTRLEKSSVEWAKLLAWAILHKKNELVDICLKKGANVDDIIEIEWLRVNEEELNHWLASGISLWQLALYQEYFDEQIALKLFELANENIFPPAISFLKNTHQQRRTGNLFDLALIKKFKFSEKLLITFENKKKMSLATKGKEEQLLAKHSSLLIESEDEFFERSINELQQVLKEKSQKETSVISVAPANSIKAFGEDYYLNVALIACRDLSERFSALVYVCLCQVVAQGQGYYKSQSSPSSYNSSPSFFQNPALCEILHQTLQILYIQRASSSFQLQQLKQFLMTLSQEVIFTLLGQVLFNKENILGSQALEHLLNIPSRYLDDLLTAYRQALIKEFDSAIVALDPNKNQKVVAAVERTIDFFTNLSNYFIYLTSDSIDFTSYGSSAQKNSIKRNLSFAQACTRALMIKQQWEDLALELRKKCQALGNPDVSNIFNFTQNEKFSTLTLIFSSAHSSEMPSLGGYTQHAFFRCCYKQLTPKQRQAIFEGYLKLSQEYISQTFAIVVSTSIPARFLSNISRSQKPIIEQEPLLSSAIRGQESIIDGEPQDIVSKECQLQQLFYFFTFFVQQRVIWFYEDIQPKKLSEIKIAKGLNARTEFKLIWESIPKELISFYLKNEKFSGRVEKEIILPILQAYRVMRCTEEDDALFSGSSVANGIEKLDGKSQIKAISKSGFFRFSRLQFTFEQKIAAVDKLIQFLEANDADSFSSTHKHSSAIQALETVKRPQISVIQEEIRFSDDDLEALQDGMINAIFECLPQSTQLKVKNNEFSLNMNSESSQKFESLN